MADGGAMTAEKPTQDVSVRDTFGIDTDMMVKGFEEGNLGRNILDTEKTN